MWESDHDGIVLDFCYEKNAILLVAYMDKVSWFRFYLQFQKNTSIIDITFIVRK